MRKVNQPLLSVIVPVYRAEKFIEKCLESIAAQTYRHMEVLVVDNASPDESGRIAEEFASRDPRFRVWHRETNGGSSASRNLALDHATGEYFAFVDADDWIEPTYFETLMEQALVTGADITVASGFVLEYEKKSVPYGTMPQTVQVIGREEAIRKLIVTAEISNTLYTKIWKKELFIGIRLIEGHTAEDKRVHWRLFQKANKVAMVPCQCYHYAQNESSIMHTHNIKSLIDYWLAYKETFDVFSDVGDDYYKATLIGCGVTIRRVWSWMLVAQKKEKLRFKEEIEEICAFSREHYREVITGSFDKRTKFSFFFARFNNIFSFFVCYCVNWLYGKLKRGKLKRG